MSIKIAETAGFCYGVKRAVDKVYKLVEEGERIGTLGELIHNHKLKNAVFRISTLPVRL